MRFRLNKFLKYHQDDITAFNNLVFALHNVKTRQDYCAWIKEWQIINCAVNETSKYYKEKVKYFGLFKKQARSERMNLKSFVLKNIIHELQFMRGISKKRFKAGKYPP